jgi:hypothetical protein
VPEKAKHVRNKLRQARPLVRSFLISGTLGLIVALILFAMAASHIVVPFILFALCPSSIVGSFADPANVWDKFAFAIFAFGSNFVLWGVIGTLICGMLPSATKD